jgi:hypothetical protein
MGRIFLPKSQSTQYTPKAGETFNDVVAKCDKADPPITADEVAFFNWGTSATVEVLRALVELVGCQKANRPDPFNSELDPSKGLIGKVYLPKVWKKSDLAYETQHKLVVKRQLPATAISITSLDAWFLPGEETCYIHYKLEGVKDRAQLLDFDVYASNYCKATAQVNGDFVDYTYSDTPDVPILQKSVSTALAERDGGEIEDWKGESEAASGVLAKRGGSTRYINAASSPYTVVLRYSKSPAKSAFIRLESFWPHWYGEGGGREIVPDSLKIKWTTKNCPGGLQGQIQIFDKDGIVWRQYLPPGKTGNGDQIFDWSNDGRSIVEEDRMPYRVQVQLHTDKDTDNGFAIAAMHTEVRLFTHPEIGTHGKDHEKEPQVLEFALAPYYAGPAPPEDSAKGRKLRLAKAGYYPGPVADGEDQQPYLQAVCEFQRDHTVPGQPTQRLRNDGTIDGNAKTAIAQLAPGRRPLFANVDHTNLPSNDDIKTALNDHQALAIVWVDDRHNYTQTRYTAAQKSKYLPGHMDLNNYRGPMSGTDVKQTKDNESICRPWIPLEVSLRVMRKNDSLYNSGLPEITEASRAATGPIRFDWTFRDLGWDAHVKDDEYNHQRARPEAYLRAAFKAIKGTHNGKDAWNCTTALGGIRGDDYYQAPFGVNSESLMPWKALPDAGPSAVCSVVHDDLGQDQKQLFDTHLGKAGVYFHPSIIAGDGYHVRAQVSFDDLPSGSTHPNWKVLRNRYDVTKLAQAHTSHLRLWRKDTLRAYIPWTPHGDSGWGSKDTEFPVFCRAAMLHFEYDGGHSTSIPLGSLIQAGEYKDLVGSTITGRMGTDVKQDRYSGKDKITFSSDYIWPWSNAKHLGILAVPGASVDVADYENVFWNDDLTNDSWDAYCPALIHFLMHRVETQKGLLRGHLIGEFLASPQYWKEVYVCSKCNIKQILIELTEDGGSAVGEDCRYASCDGKLMRGDTETYTCDVCGFVRKVLRALNIEDSSCPQTCKGLLLQVSSNPTAGMLGSLVGRNTTVYRCNQCGDMRTVNESDADVGSLGATVCGKPCKGHLRGDGATIRSTIVGPMDSLYLAAIGKPLGGLWLPVGYGARTYWAHEVGHHKHLQHAAGGGGDTPSQHDTADNPNLKDKKYPAEKSRWDRTCIMSYLSTENASDDDAGYFCGKCILKLRGWKIEGSVSNPDPGVSGP